MDLAQLRSKYPAVNLLLRSGRPIVADEPTNPDEEYILRICEFIDGLVSGRRGQLNEPNRKLVFELCASGATGTEITEETGEESPNTAVAITGIFPRITSRAMSLLLLLIGKLDINYVLDQVLPRDQSNQVDANACQVIQALGVNDDELLKRMSYAVQTIDGLANTDEKKALLSSRIFKSGGVNNNLQEIRRFRMNLDNLGSKVPGLIYLLGSKIPNPINGLKEFWRNWFEPLADEFATALQAAKPLPANKLQERYPVIHSLVNLPLGQTTNALSDEEIVNQVKNWDTAYSDLNDSMIRYLEYRAIGKTEKEMNALKAFDSKAKRVAASIMLRLKPATVEAVILMMALLGKLDLRKVLDEILPIDKSDKESPSIQMVRNLLGERQDGDDELLKRVNVVSDRIDELMESAHEPDITRKIVELRSIGVPYQEIDTKYNIPKSERRLDTLKKKVGSQNLVLLCILLGKVNIREALSTVFNTLVLSDS